MVHAGVGLVGERDVVPLLCREGAPRLHHLAAPYASPGKAGDQEEHQPHRHPGTKRLVQAAPQGAATKRKIRLQRSAQLASVARPPEIKAGQQQRQAQAGGRLDHIVAVAAHQQLAVDVGHELVPRAGLGHVTQDLSVMRIERQHAVAAVEIDTHQCRIVRPPGCHVFAELRPRVGGQRLVHLLGDAELLGLRRYLQPVAIFRRHTGDEQHDETGDGKDGEKRRHDEAGIEVPAPDGAVET